MKIETLAPRAECSSMSRVVLVSNPSIECDDNSRVETVIATADLQRLQKGLHQFKCTTRLHRAAI